MEKLYFSDEIARKLAGMHQSGLVMLEAPAGYGKTTAVRWALKETPAEALHWFTAVSFLQDAGLDWLIRQIGQLDPAAGLRNKEIAQKLCISEETVKSHIRSIFSKTNINRRSHLVGLLK